jgi:ubiquinone/menaquinone biosynthesis C-methylase UbiE
VRALLLVLLIAAGCGRDASDGEPSRLAKRNDDIARKQARFDAERRPDKVVEALALGPGSVVADIGAGTGLLTVHLARAVRPGGRVVATDIDGAALEQLAARLAWAELAAVVEGRVVDGDHPGLELATYDAILLAEVDNYLADEVAWLTEAARALKPAGRLVISNRIALHGQSLAAAARAGLTLAAESTPVPTHFVAVFTVARR